MAERLLDCSLVLFSLSLIYLLPTFPAVRRWLPGRGLWDVTLSAAALGVSSQAIIGLLWEYLPGRMPGMESLVYLGFWAALSLPSFGGRKSGIEGQPGQSPGRWLAMILLAGIALRLVYPMANAALGQSDAYSHLQFLQDIVARGQLRNPVYPSGYHWVMALPSLWFRVDPYLTARYGGAFFGGLLIVAVGLFASDAGGRKAGLVAALLTAVFPGFMPLIKTGVGAFANQMGLFFLLLILREHLACVAEEGGVERSRVLLIGVYLAGLAVSVPLMLLQVAIFIVLERSFAFFLERRLWAGRTVPLLLVLLPATLLVALHGAAVPEKTQKRTTRMITAKHLRKAPEGAERRTKNAGNTEGPLHLAEDLFSVKRWGLGSGALNAAAAVLLAGFAFTLVKGIITGRVFLAGTGLLGLFTLIQTVTGFLEFSGYQRAGWVLMLAAALLGGVLYGEVERFAGKRVPLGPVAVFGAMAVTVWAFFTPPRHAHIMSSAETEMVTVARALAQDGRFSKARWLSFERVEAPEVIGLLDPGRKLTLLTRPFSTMRGNQGNIVAAPLHRRTGIRVSQVSKKKNAEEAIMERSQLLFLIDRPMKLSSRQLGIAGTVHPGMSRTFSKWQFRLYRGNDRLRSLLEELTGKGWKTDRVAIGPNLEVIAALPPMDE